MAWKSVSACPFAPGAVDVAVPENKRARGLGRIRPAAPGAGIGQGQGGHMVSPQGAQVALAVPLRVYRGRPPSTTPRRPGAPVNPMPRPALGTRRHCRHPNLRYRGCGGHRQPQVHVAHRVGTLQLLHEFFP